MKFGILNSGVLSNRGGYEPELQNIIKRAKQESFRLPKAHVLKIHNELIVDLKACTTTNDLTPYANINIYASGARQPKVNELGYDGIKWNNPMGALAFIFGTIRQEGKKGYSRQASTSGINLNFIPSTIGIGSQTDYGFSLILNDITPIVSQAYRFGYWESDATKPALIVIVTETGYQAVINASYDDSRMVYDFGNSGHQVLTLTTNGTMARLYRNGGQIQSVGIATQRALPSSPPFDLASAPNNAGVNPPTTVTQMGSLHFQLSKVDVTKLNAALRKFQLKMLSIS